MLLRGCFIGVIKFSVLLGDMKSEDKRGIGVLCEVKVTKYEVSFGDRN